MEAEALCYVLTFVKEGKCRKYIGHTKHFRNRLWHHFRQLSQGIHHNKTLQKLYNDGWEYDDKPDLIPMPTKELAHKFEQRLIEANRDNPEVVNIECGNDTFTNNPNKEEYRIKLVENLRNWRESLSEEDRLIILSKWGDRNGMFGRTHTPSSRALIREKINAFYAVNESVNKGKPKSDKHREIMSKNASLRIGELNPFYGKSHSEETRRRLSEVSKGRLPPNLKKVSIEGKVYESMTEAGRQIGIGTPLVLFRIKSKNPRFSEWKWFEMPND